MKQRDFHNPLPAALRAAAYHKNCRTAHIGQPTRSDVSLNGAKTDKISKPVQHLKFYSIFFKKLRGRGAVRQRKFGFQTKLPGRKRPSSGVFSDLRSEARHPPRRPLSLPCGRGVGDPSPQAPPRQAGLGCFLLFHNLKFYSIFFKKSRGRGAFCK